HDMRDDGPGRCPERTANSNLLGSLADDDDHDVADAEHAGEERRQTDDPHEDLDATKERIDLLCALRGVVAADRTAVLRVDLLALAQGRAHVVLDQLRRNAFLRGQGEPTDAIALR